jgi:hypothetical protein
MIVQNFCYLRKNVSKQINSTNKKDLKQIDKYLSVFEGNPSPKFLYKKIIKSTCNNARVHFWGNQNMFVFKLWNISFLFFT